jgi:hypothetical protein
MGKLEGLVIHEPFDLDKRKGRIFVAPKKAFESSSKTPNIQANINAVQPNQYQHQHPLQNQHQMHIHIQDKGLSPKGTLIH